ncbi:hypothetical protein OBBRIDRAFT_748297 [Obba rivulosa]|uniref:MARVEL domain-containing protein n=1 Tax=Obba rivulosa TaxID=1052685 RepID=A0A8E2DQU1_9APHY|nr:hypothetical protein OBBRIDRAFT_748297 [Obba rivulosa]
MTQLFKDMRLYGYVIVLLLSATVLGISAYLASIFLPNIQHDFSLFSLIVPSLTILIFLITISWSSPRTEVLFLFILGVLWLAMGAWSQDILGSLQCDALGGERTTIHNGGSISTRAWCYEMKVIEAFSWMNFCLFAIFLWAVIALTARSKVLGRPYAWGEPIFELPWFGQYPGPPGPYQGGYQMPMYPGGMQYGPQMMNNGYVVQQNPGHAVVIQPNMGGLPPTITQVPSPIPSP